jgi:predicted acetyltransferase
VLAETATPPGAPCEAVIWESDSGEPQGYVVFIMPSQGPDAGKVVSLQFAALTADAYLNLTTFLGRHDIHSEIRLYRPSDDPLPLLFEDTDRLEIRQGYTALLRIVDVEAALKTRPAAGGGAKVEFSLEVRDQCANWNEGVFRLATQDGSVEVERTSGAGDLTVDARVLAPIFNGYITPSAAAATGQLRAASAKTLAQADAFFAVTHRPYFPDRF